MNEHRPPLRWSAERARARRHALRLSQGDVARALGVHRSTVAEWEAGNTPRLDHASALARLLGVTVDDLLAPSPEVPSCPTRS